MTVSREKDKASLGIDAIRSIKEELLMIPNDLEIKAYIIEEADLLTIPAQNAFLLTMEEPPRFVLFFLLCENARSLLETIRSRAPVIRTEPLSPEAIGSYICSDMADKNSRETALSLKKTQPDEFNTVIVSADGSIGRALTLLSPKTRKPISDRRALADAFIGTLRTTGDPSMTLFNKFSQKREELTLQLGVIKEALRDLILLKKSENAPLSFYADRESALDLSSTFSEKKLMLVFDAIESAELAMSKNANLKLTVVNLLAKI